MPTIEHTIGPVTDVWPVGTVVSLWLDPMRDLRGAAPPGDALTSAAVSAAGLLTFTVDPETRYVAYAAGVTRSFVSPSLESTFATLVDRVSALEAEKVIGCKVVPAAAAEDRIDGNAGFVSAAPFVEGVNGTYLVTLDEVYFGRIEAVTASPISSGAVVGAAWADDDTITVEVRDLAGARSNANFALMVKIAAA